MVKKITPLESYISAHDAAQLLSLKHERPIDSKYIRRLSKRAKNPVRTQQMSNRLLYNRDDILACTVKAKGAKRSP